MGGLDRRVGSEGGRGGAGLPCRRRPPLSVRTAFTVNGKFGLHTLEVHRGDVLDVELINSIPSDYPDTDEVGTTLHWHGLSLTGSDYWYDGVPYMTQCPVPPGSKQRIRFRVVDGPGLFWWHSHVGLQSADGLSGLLVVRPPRGVSDAAAAIPKHDKEILLTVGDWWHSPGAALAFPIGRPFDRRKQTNATGAYWWADVPQAVLMNGRGIASDCTPLPYLSNATIQCAPKAAWVPPGRLGAVASPGSAAASPGCARTNFTVAAGATVLWRVANVGSLMDLSFCVDGHELTVVAADGVPVAPYKLGAGLCAELNLGQRLDLLMTATTTPGAYWVSALSNYRPAAPHGYAVLKVEAGVAAAPPLPPAPAPQTGAVPPWDVKLLNALTMPAWLAGKADPPAGVDPLLAAAGAPLAVPPRSTRFVFLNNTQPFLPTGQVRWALNQVVNSGPPACGAYAQKVVAAGAAAIEADARLTEAKGANADVGTSLGVQDAGAEEGPVYVYGRAGSGLAALSTPVVGRQVVLLDEGDVVDVVLQNLPPFTNQGNVSRPEDAPKVGGGGRRVSGGGVATLGAHLPAPTPLCSAGSSTRSTCTATTFGCSALGTATGPTRCGAR